MGKKIEGVDMRLAVSASWLVSAPVDFLCGADRLLVHLREALGRDPLDGSAYELSNRRTSRMKVLVVDAQEVWLSTRHLHLSREVIWQYVFAMPPFLREKAIVAAPDRLTWIPDGALRT